MAFKKSIVLGLDSTSFDQGIDSANQKIDQFESNLDGTKASTQAAANNLDELGDSADDTAQAVVDMSQQLRNGVDILSSVAQAVRAATDAAMEYANDIKTMSMSTGLSTDAVQQLGYVAAQTGTDIDHVSQALKGVEKAMFQAANGTGKAGQVFRELGVEILDVNGKTRDASQVFMEVIQRLSEMDNSTERSQAALKLFGDSAKDLNGMISLGSEGIQSLINEFDELGASLSGEDIQALTDAERSIKSMQESFKSAAAELVASFAPAIQAAADLLKNLSPEAKQAIMVIATLTAGFLGLSLAIGALGAIYTTMMGTMGAATQAFMAQAGPIMVVVAAVGALALALKELIDTYNEWKEKTGGDSFFTFMTDPEAPLREREQARSIAGAGRNAKGSNYWRGGLTWVGEEGPELVNLPQGSRIYNNKQSTSIGGNTYNINMNMDMAKIKKVNDVIEAVDGLSISAGCRR